MDTMLSSQPENYKQLIRRSIKLYRASFSKVALFAFLLAIIVFIPRLLSYIIGQDIFLNLPPLSLHRLWLIVINLAGLLFFIAIIWHVHCVIRGVHEPLIEDVVMGIKKVIYVFIAALIQSAIVFGVAAAIYGLQILLHAYHLLFANNLTGILVTFFIFAIQLILIVYISTLFLFLVPLIAIEENGVFTSLEHSLLLVWNHWWRVFSVQLTPWLCYILLLLTIKYVLKIDIHIYFTEYAHHSIWATLLHLVIFALFIPWVAAILLVQLKDLELRADSVKLSKKMIA